MTKAMLVDELPNIVVNEEGFHVAAFRFPEDAAEYVETINSRHPCAVYMLKEEHDRLAGED